MQGKRLQAECWIFHHTTFQHQGAILIEELLQMLGRVEQYSTARPSSIKLQCWLGKFRNNVEKGEWVLFSNTSFTHKLRILLQKPHYPILPYTQILTNKMILKQRDLSWSEFTELFVRKKWKMRVELSLQHLRQVKVVQIQYWRLIHMIVMGKFLTEYEKTEKDKKVFEIISR